MTVDPFTQVRTSARDVRHCGFAMLPAPADYDDIPPHITPWFIAVAAMCVVTIVGLVVGSTVATMMWLYTSVFE